VLARIIDWSIASGHQWCKATSQQIATGQGYDLQYCKAFPECTPLTFGRGQVRKMIVRMRDRGAIIVREAGREFWCKPNFAYRGDPE
jgi:hypothetical protein